MGKRELLIAIAFICVGVVAFQFTAPPAQKGSGFSLAKLIDSAKREMRGTETHVAPPRTVSIPVPPGIEEVRFVGIQGPLKVVGERRDDIEMVLTIQSTGETREAAIAIANKTEVLQDLVGNLLKLEMKYPPEERQRSQATIKVPERLAIRLEGSTETSVSNVRSVATAIFLRGNTQIENVAGSVSGEQRDGTLTVTNAKSVKMRLTRARTKLSGVSDGIILDMTDGQAEIASSTGPLEIDERRAAVTVRAHKGPVRVGGSDGSVTIEGTMDEVKIDVRRTEVDAVLAAGKTSSIVTTDERLKITWPDSAPAEFDAITVDGNVDAADWNLTPSKKENETRLQQTVGAKTSGTPRISLRNQGGDIVIRKQAKNKQ
jgi:hypothetical protein